jgi:hypothetical protein
MAVLWLILLQVGSVQAAQEIGEAAAVAKIHALGGEIQRRSEHGGLDDSDLGTGKGTDDPVILVAFIGNEKVKDDDLQCLQAFPDLEYLFLGRTKIGDSGLRHIAGLTHLKRLGLIGTRVTDIGLKKLEGLQELEAVLLGNTAATDAGLSSLCKLKNLDSDYTTPTSWKPSQDLGMTKITDAGLEAFGDLKNLKTLLVGVTRVTSAGQDRLKVLLPQIKFKQEQLGQRTDPDFDVSIAHPSYSEKHPAVLFDEAHRNFHTARGRYKVFADLISNDGCRITPSRDSLTPELLGKFDLFITANAPAKSTESPSAFTSKECDAVESWVQGGGALLLITDHEPFGSGSQELAKRFGVNMSLLVSVDPKSSTKDGLLFSRAEGRLGDHPILQGRDQSERINRVLTFTGQSLNGPPGSAQLLKFSDTAMDVGRGNKISAAGRAQGIAFTYGKGRVVVMGEAGELSAQISGEDPVEKMGMNVPGCDNRQLALNIIHWLTGLIEGPTSFPRNRGA